MGSSVSSLGQSKEDKRKTMLKYTAAALLIGGTVALVYVLGYRKPKPKRERPPIEAKPMQLERRPFVPVVTSVDDQEVKLELKRKLTGFKGAAPITKEQLADLVKQFRSMMDNRDWGVNLHELAGTARQVEGFEDQFEPKLRLGAARLLHTNSTMLGLLQSQGQDVDLSLMRHDFQLARQLLDFNPDQLTTQEQYEAFLLCKIELCSQLHDYSEVSTLFGEAMERSSYSYELLLTLVNQSLSLGEWDAFLKLHSEALAHNPSFDDLFRSLSLEMAAVPDMKVMEMLIRNERPRFHSDPAILRSLRYSVSSLQLKLNDVTGDDAIQVQETKDALLAMYGDWRNEQFENVAPALVIQGALIMAANLFPDTGFAFTGYWDTLGKRFLIQKLDEMQDIQRYELKYSSTDVAGELWTGKFSVVTPREGRNNSVFPAGTICEFSARLCLVRIEDDQ